MIAAAIALLSTRWVQYALASLAAAALLWFGVINPYNNWVTDKAVESALAEERAKTEPIFKELMANFNDLETTFKNITEASNAELARRIAEINTKTKELGYALAQNKTLKSDLAGLRGANDEFERLLGSIEANNNRTTGASASTRLKQLSAAHQQCERSLRESDGDLAETLGRLDEALAVVRALRN